MLRVLILSPFHGNSSHAAWAEGYREHSKHEVLLVTLPDRYWSWRLKGGSVGLSDKLRGLENVDAIIATSLTCLAGFFGLNRRSYLSEVPAVYYMHENQLTYPIRPGGKRDSQLILRQFHSQLSADQVWWNSDFNRRSWFKRMPGFLKGFPDFQGLERLDSLQEKSVVMPLGLSLGPRERLTECKGGHRLLWSQRWEWEKGTDRFVDFLKRFGNCVPFEVLLLGGAPKGKEPLRISVEEYLAEKLVHSGWCEREDYDSFVRSATFTVSVARHEFFGISILEAAARGVVPFLPDALSYPEIIPQRLHDRLLYSSLRQLYREVHKFLAYPADLSLREELQDLAYRFEWSEMAPKYDLALEKLVG